MAMMRGLLALALALAMGNVPRCYADMKISDVNILLPSTGAVSKVLVAKSAKSATACFRWKSSRPDVASVKPLIDGKNVDEEGADTHDSDNRQRQTQMCSSRALVTAKSAMTGKTSRAMSLITAEDSNGNILKCEAWVAKIDRLQILTTVRRLDVGASETIEVKAFDEFDNVFTTLSSLHFSWTTEDESVLRVVPLTETEVDATPLQQEMEMRGLLSDSVQIQGVRTGSVNITVSLSGPGHETVTAGLVRVDVSRVLFIEPQQARFLAPGAELEMQLFTIEQKRRQRMQEAERANYRWSSSAPEVAKMDKGGDLVAVAVGSTTVSVHDLKVKGNTQTVDMDVTEPTRVRLSVQEAGEDMGAADITNWNLVRGRSYIVTVHMHDAQERELYPTRNVRYDIQMGTSLTAIEGGESEEHRIGFVATTIGRTTIEAALLGLAGDRTESQWRWRPAEGPIKVSASASVTEQVGLRSHQGVLLLPWSPPDHQTSVTERHEFHLTAEGGSGEYDWSISDTTVAAVGPEGTVWGGAIGSASLVVSDASNSRNSFRLAVDVARVEQLLFLSGPVEAEVGDWLVLRMSAMDDRGRSFCNCSALKNAISIDLAQDVFADASIVDGEAPEGDDSGAACATIRLRAARQGTARLSVSMQYDGAELVAHVDVSAFAPLEVVLPVATSSPYALVTLGSVAHVAVRGGPLPLGSGQHGRAVMADGNAVGRLLPVQLYSTQASSIYGIVCEAHGRDTFSITLENSPRDLASAFMPEPQPLRRSASIPFICAPPASARIVMSIDDQGKEDDTADSSAGETETRNTVDATMQDAPQYMLRAAIEAPAYAIVMDSDGRAFTNFSTLAIAWESSKEETVQLESDRQDLYPLPGSNNAEEQSPAQLLRRMFSRTHVKGISEGSAILRARLTPGSVECAAHIHVMQNAVLDPASAVLFLHSQHSLLVTAVGGSGHSTFSVDDPLIGALQESPERGDGRVSVVIRPVAEGRLRVVSTDTVLLHSDPAISDVLVSSVMRLHVHVVDKVPMGGSALVSVVAEASDGTPFDIDQVKRMDLTFEYDGALINVTSFHDGANEVRIDGLAVGTTSLSASIAHEDGLVVASTPVHIQVFPPLRLQPRRIVLIPGSNFELAFVGGPVVGSTMRFTSRDSAVATVAPHPGAVPTLLAVGAGETEVIIECIGVDGATQEEVMYARDAIPVTVAHLSRISIAAPPQHVLLGSAQKLMAKGQDGIGALAFGGLPLDRLEFSWRSDNTEILALSSDGFSAWMHARGVGAATVSVKVHDTETGVTVTDSTTVAVSPPLLLETPSTVLLWPGATFKVRTNYDGKVPLKSSLTHSNIVSLSPRDDGALLIEAGSTPGIAVIVLSTEAGDQSLAMMVEVRPVSQLNIIGNPIISVGGSTELEVELRDDLGRTFDGVVDASVEFTATNSFLRIEASESSKDHRSFTVRSWREGHSIVKFWLSGCNPPSISVSSEMVERLAAAGSAELPPVSANAIYETNTVLADYILIRVVNTILPRSPVLLHVGANVNFSIEKRDGVTTDRDGGNADGDSGSDGEGGQWSSSDPSTLAVTDVGKGSATAIAPGSATVRFASTISTTTSKVIVTKVATIKADLSAVSGSVSLGRPQALPVRFFGADGGELKSSRHVDQNIDLSCSLAAEQGRWARTSVVCSESGELACLIEAVKLEPHAVEGGGKGKTKKVWSPLPPFSRMSLSINAGPATLSLPEAVSLVPGIQVRTFAADGTEIPPGECIDLQPFSTHATIKVFSARPLDSFRATTSAGFTLDAPRSDVLGDAGGYISHWKVWATPSSPRDGILKIVDDPQADDQNTYEACIRYGQTRHEWYCLEVDEALLPVTEEGLTFSRSACSVCPRSDSHGSTRAAMNKGWDEADRAAAQEISGGNKVRISRF
eukprot:g3367.t1